MKLQTLDTTSVQFQVSHSAISRCVMVMLTCVTIAEYAYQQQLVFFYVFFQGRFSGISLNLYLFVSLLFWGFVMGREEKRDLKVMRSSSEVSSWLEFLSFFWGGVGWGFICVFSESKPLNFRLAARAKDSHPSWP